MDLALNIYLDLVHTTPFSNENGTVLLRFQNDSRPPLLFPYRFRPSTLQRVAIMKTILRLIFCLHYSPRDKIVPPH